MTTTDGLERRLSSLIRYASSSMRFINGIEGAAEDSSLESDLVDAAGTLALRIRQNRPALDLTDPSRPWY